MSLFSEKKEVRTMVIKNVNLGNCLRNYEQDTG